MYFYHYTDNTDMPISVPIPIPILISAHHLITIVLASISTTFSTK